MIKEGGKELCFYSFGESLFSLLGLCTRHRLLLIEEKLLILDLQTMTQTKANTHARALLCA